MRCGLSKTCDSYRVFFCAHCSKRVVICRCCDHGNYYCPDNECSKQHRIKAKRRYRADYQNTHIGRRNHAASQARYRLKQAQAKSNNENEIMTDHGFTPSDFCTTTIAKELWLINYGLSDCAMFNYDTAIRRCNIAKVLIKRHNIEQLAKNRDDINLEAQDLWLRYCELRDKIRMLNN